MRERGEAAIRADVAARAYRLNERQAAALDHVLADGTISLADLQRLFPGVTRRTLQRDLAGMVDRRLLREVGRGPTDPHRHYLLGKL